MWYVPCTTTCIPKFGNQEDINDETTSLENMEIQEWGLLSRMGHINYNNANDIQMFGRCKFDTK